MSVYSRSHETGVPDAKKNDKAADDDWDTDPEPVNAGLSEKDLRKGSSFNRPTEKDATGPNLADVASQYKNDASQKSIDKHVTTQKNLYGEKRLDENVSGQ